MPTWPLYANPMGAPAATQWRGGTASFLGFGWGDAHGSLVSAAGMPGAEYRLNSDEFGTERNPSVTELRDGGFLVVWLDGDVEGRRFNSAGNPVGPDFKINTLPTASPTSKTDAAIGWDGWVLVVWEDGGTENPPLPGSNGNIRGRLYDAKLNPLGNDFRINDLFAGRQNDPRIAELGPRGFLVIWSSATVSAGPDTTQSIEARVVSGPNAFDSNGDGNDDNQVQFNVWDNNAGQNYPPVTAGTGDWLPAGSRKPGMESPNRTRSTRSSSSAATWSIACSATISSGSVRGGAGNHWRWVVVP